MVRNIDDLDTTLEDSSTSHREEKQKNLQQQKLQIKTQRRKLYHVLRTLDRNQKKKIKTTMVFQLIKLLHQARILSKS